MTYPSPLLGELEEGAAELLAFYLSDYGVQGVEVAAVARSATSSVRQDLNDYLTDNPELLLDILAALVKPKA